MSEAQAQAQRRRLIWGRIALAIALVGMLTGAIFGLIARFQ
jgi:hypothetical protein